MRERAAQLLLGVCASLVVLGAAATGWACTVMASVSVSPGEARAGESVTVQGLKFVADRDIEVMLVSEDRQTRLWQGRSESSGSFTARGVAIPTTATPGDHTIVARTADGQFRASAGFLVNGPAQAAPAPAPTAQPAPAPAPAPTAQPAPNPAPAAPQVAAPAPAAATQAPEPAVDSSPRSAAAATATSPAAAQARPATPSGTPVGPSAEPIVSAASPVAAAATAAGSGVQGPVPVGSSLRRSASDDLWSGFAAGSGRSLDGRTLMTPVAPAGAGPGGLALGVVLLSVGLVVLGSGGAVVAVRRSRARAHSV